MSLFQRLYDALTIGSPADELEYADDVEEYASTGWQGEPIPGQRKLPPPDNVVGMWGESAEMLLVEPRSLEDIPQVISALRERKSVILNLNLMDADTAQRCVDFVAGGVFAIDGHQHRIGQTVFLFTPSNVQISHQTFSDETQPNAIPKPAWLQ